MELATRLLPWFYQLSIALLTDFHHDRINGDIEHVVMNFRVLINSCNLNAQINYNLMTVIKQKP
jgi:hypothetical protein